MVKWGPHGCTVRAETCTMQCQSLTQQAQRTHMGRALQGSEAAAPTPQRTLPRVAQRSRCRCRLRCGQLLLLLDVLVLLRLVPARVRRRQGRCQRGLLLLLLQRRRQGHRTRLPQHLARLCKGACRAGRAGTTGAGAGRGIKHYRCTRRGRATCAPPGGKVRARAQPTPRGHVQGDTQQCPPRSGNHAHTHATVGVQVYEPARSPSTHLGPGPPPKQLPKRRQLPRTTPPPPGGTTASEAPDRRREARHPLLRGRQLLAPATTRTARPERQPGTGRPARHTPPPAARRTPQARSPASRSRRRRPRPRLPHMQP